jgi:hypothetical protein
MKSNRRLSDQEWADLQLKASICPHQPSWPTEQVHWRRLHEVANGARERVRRAYAAMDEIDNDAAFTVKTRSISAVRLLHKLLPNSMRRGRWCVRARP